MRRHSLTISFFFLIAIPIAAFAFVKPLRVISPGWMPGVECPDSTLCIDDVSRLADAKALYDAGTRQAALAVGPFRGQPRAIFCSTQACAEQFGIGQRAAEAVGNLGVVVAPRGWKPFYLAHELIHYRQAETLGNLAVATKPRWLIEGMAYSLSGDPRHPLTAPFEQWRTQFEAWNASRGSRDLWDAAKAAR